MITLQDASRRLRMPVEVLWKWIADGTLEADIQRGRGFGMEYLLNTDQVKSARELRDQRLVKGEGGWAEPAPKPGAARVTSGDFDKSTGVTDTGDSHAAKVPSGQGVPVRYPDANNVIAFAFGDARSRDQAPATVVIEPEPPARSSALIAMENLRADAMAAVRRQTEREAALVGMVSAVEMVVATTVRALERAQDLNEARVTAELETLRARLAHHVRGQEQDELAFRDELARARTELATALKAIDPGVDSPPLAARMAASGAVDRK
ncbi:MAG TPA: hypothetical protein VG815_16490 [Chloroflexota bacterium]|jgi:hypothetical protein|nr:hypothetical protein [Chloroflexota bacterium]